MAKEAFAPVKIDQLLTGANRAPSDCHGLRGRRAHRPGSQRVIVNLDGGEPQGLCYAHA